MASSTDLRLAVALFSSFLFAPFVPYAAKVFGKKLNFILGGFSLLLCIYFVVQISSTSELNPILFSSPWAPSLNIDLSLSLDGLSLFFSVLIAGLGALVFLYSGEYLGSRSDLNRFYVTLLLFMGSMLGIVLSENLILLYVFWELTTLSSFLLIGFEHDKEEARRNAWQAILTTSAGGLALLAGILLLGKIGGTFSISSLFSRTDEIRNHFLFIPTLLLILIGAFTKSAQFPFHYWLPNAMTAPTPISAYLHSATMVKAGIYLMARLSPLFTGSNVWFKVVSIVGVVTMLTGSFLSLGQTDLKLVLAYMTIMALGALTMLLGIGTPEAINAAVVFLLVHSLYKGALFLTVGAVDHEAGTRNVLELGGLYKKMRYTATAALLAVLSMAGVPPLVGFIGKELIYKSTLGVVGLPAFVFVGAVVLSMTASTAVSSILFVETFLKKPKQELGLITEVPFSMWLGPMVLGVLSAWFGIFSETVKKPLIEPAVRVILRRQTAMTTFPTIELSLPLGLSIVSILGGLSIYFIWPILRRKMVSLDSLMALLGPSACYESLLAGLKNLARHQTKIIENGHLRYYLLTLFSVTAGAAGYFSFSQPWRSPSALPPKIAFYEWVVAGLVICGSVATVFAKTVLTSVTFLGIVGYATALIYVFYGAPDLALTQFLVDTLTIVFVALIFTRLPEFEKRSSSIWTICCDALVSILFGLLMTRITSMVLEEPFNHQLSKYYSENSLRLGNGNNIVNVILVDFRALDTLGEITVLAVAATAVFSLIKLSNKKGSDSYR